MLLPVVWVINDKNVQRVIHLVLMENCPIQNEWLGVTSRYDKVVEAEIQKK